MCEGVLKGDKKNAKKLLMQKLENDEVPDAKLAKLDANHDFIALYYIINILIVAIVTKLLKQVFKGARSERPNYDDDELKYNRAYDMRSRYTDSSPPRDDSTQVSLLYAFTFLNMPLSLPNSVDLTIIKHIIC